MAADSPDKPEAKPPEESGQPAAGRGIRCATCGAVLDRVQDTRRTLDGVKRWRRCAACATVHVTTERVTARRRAS